MRAQEIWRLPPDELEAAQDAATLQAIHDQEACGVDVITDGEVRRESYSNRFATSLEGLDFENPGTALDLRGKRENQVPRVVSALRRPGPVQVRDASFLRQNARPSSLVKITLPGPFTMAHQCHNDYYPSREEVAMAFAECINAEVRDLFAAGVDIVQLDEPYVQVCPEEAQAYAVRAIDAALQGVRSEGQETAVHTSFGYAHVHKEQRTDKPSGYSFFSEFDACENVDEISVEFAQPKDLDVSMLSQLPSKAVAVGVLDLSRNTMEDVETHVEVAKLIREVLHYVPPERLVVSQDTGMKYLSREVALAKLRAMVVATEMVRAEWSLSGPFAQPPRF